MTPQNHQRDWYDGGEGALVKRDAGSSERQLRLLSSMVTLR